MSVVERGSRLDQSRRQRSSEILDIMQEAGLEHASFDILFPNGVGEHRMSPEEIERFAEHFERESIQIENSLCRDGRAADPVDFKDAQFPSRK